MRHSTLLFVLLVGCTTSQTPAPDGGVTCVSGTTTCEGSTFVECSALGGPVAETRTSCARSRRTCDPSLGCVVCIPGSVGCAGAHPGVCRADGSGYDANGTCDVAAGQACSVGGQCTDLCAAAAAAQSYAGCELRAVDLDNGVDGPLVASAQQYALVVANPSNIDSVVTIERAPGAAESGPVEIARATIAPGGLHVFELPAQTIDGASTPSLNDGTHSAVTNVAWRVRSTAPVIAYQFNPLQPEGTFSADASLLLPTTAWGRRYTVNAWPQTIGPFFPYRLLGQQRSFLTVAAAQEQTTVTVTLGPNVLRVAGCDAFEESGPGDVITVTLGAFGVLNLETDAFAGDFTGTVVDATADVGVFVGNEAANVPHFDDPLTRIRAADHLEEQLLPDRAVGTHYVIARMPARTRAIYEAFADPSDAPLTPVEEADWVRIVAIDRPATVSTGLPGEDANFTLMPGASRTVRVAADTVITSDNPISVMQYVSGQELTGIPNHLPGGDPASIAVPPVDQFRNRYTFLVPEHHAFDFAVVVAPRNAVALLDGDPLDEVCAVSEIESASWQVYRCALSAPLLRTEEPFVDPGVQHDGTHVLDSDMPVGLVVYGFDRFISYAYTGGLDLSDLI